MFHYDYKEEKLAGVLCGRRPTPCAGQLEKVGRVVYEARRTV